MSFAVGVSLILCAWCGIRSDRQPRRPYQAKLPRVRRLANTSAALRRSDGADWATQRWSDDLLHPPSRDFCLRTSRQVYQLNDLVVPPCIPLALVIAHRGYPHACLRRQSAGPALTTSSRWSSASRQNILGALPPDPQRSTTERPDKARTLHTPRSASAAPLPPCRRETLLCKACPVRQRCRTSYRTSAAQTPQVPLARGFAHFAAVLHFASLPYQIAARIFRAPSGGETWEKRNEFPFQFLRKSNANCAIFRRSTDAQSLQPSQESCRLECRKASCSKSFPKSEKC